MADLNARIIAKASGTTGEEPLAGDLEVAELAVNTADGKLFTKHTDNSIVTISGGGGGAVDSVNGQTGVVSLGVEDLNNTAESDILFTEYRSSTDINNNGQDGDWNVNTLFRYFYFYNAGSDADVMERLQVGDSVTFDWSDGPSTTQTVSAAAVSSGGLASYVQFDNSTGWQVSGTVALTSERFTATDSQVLTWVAARSQWEPADASGAVDSVNDQTGVVSLGIGDLNDTASTDVLFTEYTTSGDINSNGQDGDWNVNTLFRYFYFYNAGSEAAAMEGLQTGDSVTFNWSDGPSTTQTVSAAAVSSGGLASYVQFDNSTGWQASGTVTLSSSRFGPSDGQVLTWVAANNQWEPAQLRTAAETRTLLGIGEYVDDAAAGTGGVASGAMYYNTTSGDYRLKT
jgi:hypothetical protein